MKYDKVYCITPAKVGTGTFLHSFNKIKHTIHRHSLEKLKRLLTEETKETYLIIVGFRKAWEHYISYFFQHYRDNFFNDFKTKKNNYEGEYCLTDIENRSLSDVLYNWKYKGSYFDWIEEFVEITNIKHFDKENGFSLYNRNNHTIVIYNMDNINKVINFFENLLDIKFKKRNINKNKKYLEAKKIPPDEDFLNKMKSCEAYKIFINDE